MANTLQVEWDKRLELFAKSDKIKIEADKIYIEAEEFYSKADKFEASERWDEGHKFRIKANKLRVEANRLYVESISLIAEGCIIWDEAVVKLCGNSGEAASWDTDLKTRTYNCTLINGEVYTGNC